MASEVDICNLALGHLGDAANVASINPPDGSAQADHCARYYPIARDALLEMHDWSFASRREALVEVQSESDAWDYCYAQPNGVLTIRSVQGPADSDTFLREPFSAETLANGAQVIYTNVPDAVLRYTGAATSPTVFSPLFVTTLAASLASMLAGPIIKGDAGSSAAARWQTIAFGRDGRSGLYGQAASNDSAQKRTNARDTHKPAWIAGR